MAVLPETQLNSGCNKEDKTPEQVETASLLEKPSKKESDTNQKNSTVRPKG